MSRRHLSSPVVLLALSLFGLLLMGVGSCSQPKEYCTFYSVKADQEACTTYCAAAGEDLLVQACQAGQEIYLTKLKFASSLDALLICDRQLSGEPVLDKACRDGVAAETLRASQSRSGHGTANDRETGNGH